MWMTDIKTTTLLITLGPRVSCAYLKFVAGLGVHLILPIVHQLNWQRAVQSIPEHLHRMSTLADLLKCRLAPGKQASRLVPSAQP